MQNEQEKYFEIDLMRLLSAIWHRAWIIALVAVVCAAAALGITKFFITPMYQAEAMLYINNNKTSDQSNTVSAADITASQSLAETYMAILDSRTVLSEVIQNTGSSCSTKELQENLSASVVNSTELLKITITDPDPKTATLLANETVAVSSQTMMETVSACTVKIVDYAAEPEKPSSPNAVRNTALGFLIGLLLSMAVVVLLDLTNTVIRSEKDLNAQFEGVPVLGVIPDLSRQSEGGYGYGYSSARTGSGNGKESSSGRTGSGGGKEASADRKGKSES